MTFLYKLLIAFAVGGGICAICQIFLEKTKLNAPKLLVALVVLGGLLGIFGVYEPFAKFAGAGATVPLLGFGASLVSGAREAVAAKGPIGILTGGLTATAGGITAAVIFGFLAALLFKARTKP